MNITSEYLVLDGTKTINKESFLKEIGILLNFPDHYGQTWKDLIECLREIVSIWEDENPPYIEKISDPHGIIPKDFIINIIWLDPLDFSVYNSDDFYTALDILKEANYDKKTPLKFVLASNVRNININSTTSNSNDTDVQT